MGPTSKYHTVVLCLILVELAFLPFIFASPVASFDGAISADEAKDFLNPDGRKLTLYCSFQQSYSWGSGSYWVDSWCAEELREGWWPEERSECFNGFCMYCDIGNWRYNSDCYYCGAGKFRSYRSNANYADCELCPVNSYQPYGGQTFCYSCPAYSSTSAGGQTSINSCICESGKYMSNGQCYDAPKGYYSLANSNTIIACPQGQYQDQTRQNSCKACPAYSTTAGSAASDVSQCVCNAGRTMVNGMCEMVDACASRPCGDYQCVDKGNGVYQCLTYLTADAGEELCQAAVDVATGVQSINPGRTTNPSLSPANGVSGTGVPTAAARIGISAFAAFEQTVTTQLSSGPLAQLDLYILQDLSSSFQDDLDYINGYDLMGSLWDTFSARTSDLRIGVGSFADKPVSPLGLGSYFNPSTNTYQAMSYVYRNWQSVEGSTKDKLRAAYKSMYTVDGGDTKDSQLEALYRFAVGANDIGCSGNSETKPYASTCMRSTARRVVFIVTDSPYHVAGDYASQPAFSGVVSGDRWLQDSKFCEGCDAPEGSTSDYPSVSQVAQALLDASIYPVFVVAGDTSAYSTLVSTWGFGRVVSLDAQSTSLVNTLWYGNSEAEQRNVLAVVSDPRSVVAEVRISPEATGTSNRKTRSHDAYYAPTNFVVRFVSSGQVSDTVRLAYLGNGFLDIDIVDSGTASGCTARTYTPYAGLLQANYDVTTTSVTSTSNKLDFYNQNNNRGSAWFKNSLYFADGFKVRFDFERTGGTVEGFAFVMHRAANLGIYAMGDGGSQLGYGNIPYSLAVEFDMVQSYDREDADASHVSVHSRYKDNNDAMERYSIKRTTQLSPGIANGRFTAEIEYVNCPRMLEVTVWQSGVMLSGFPLRVPVDRARFPFFFDTAPMGTAFMGFTSSGYQWSRLALYDITLSTYNNQMDNAIVSELPVSLDGGVEDFLLIGPYPRLDSKINIGICGCDKTQFQFTVDPNNPLMPYEGMVDPNTGKKWTTFHGHFTDTMGYGNYNEVWGATYVYSPIARSVIMSVGSDDGAYFWLNHVQQTCTATYNGVTLSQDGCHPPGEDQYRCPATLKKGWNTLMFKVGNRYGNFGIYARFLDTALRPITDLRVSLRPYTTSNDVGVQGTANGKVQFTIRSRDGCDVTRGNGNDFTSVSLVNTKTSAVAACSYTFDTYREFYWVTCPNVPAAVYSVSTNAGCPKTTSYGESSTCATITVGAGSIYADSSILHYPSSVPVVGTSAVTATVSPRDVTGNVVALSASDASLFDVSLYADGVFQAKAALTMDYTNNVYVANFGLVYRLTASYSIIARYNGIQFGTLSSYYIARTAPSASAFTVTNIASTSAAGEARAFSIALTDVWGNPASAATVTVSFKNGATVVGPLTPTFDGYSTYSTSYTLTLAGTYSVIGTVNGAAITKNGVDTGVVTTVLPGPVVLSNTIMTGLTSGASIPSYVDQTFTLKARDQYLNVRVSDPASKWVITPSASLRIKGVTALSDGTVQVVWYGTTTGASTLTIAHADAGYYSQVPFTVIPGSMYSMRTIFTNTNFGISAGTQYDVIMQTYDYQGNVRTSTSTTDAQKIYRVCWSTTETSTPASIPTSQCVAPTALGDGRLQATFPAGTFKTVATYYIYRCAENYWGVISPSSAAPQSSYKMTISVTPMKLNPASCTASTIPTSFDAGTDQSFNLIARDIYGNTVPAGYDELTASRLSFVFTVGGATLDSTAAQFLDVSKCATGSSTDGCYLVRFRVTAAGSLSVLVRVDGVNIQNPSLSMTVKPLTTVGSTSTYVTAQPMTFTAGALADVTIQARDRYGNLQTVVSNEAWTVTFSSDPTATFAVRAGASAGQYIFTVNTTVAGSQTLRIRHQASASDLSLATVRVNPTTIAGAKCSLGTWPASTTAGDSITVTIIVRDTYGNAYDAASANAAASKFNLRWKTDAGVLLASAVGTVVSGQVAGQATVTKAQWANVEADYQGQAFPSTGRTYVNPAALATTQVSSTLSTVAAGSATKVTLSGYDKYSNFRGVGGGSVGLNVRTTSGSSVSVAATCQDRLDGTYDCTFTPTLAGSYRAYAVANAVEGSSSIAFTVTAGVLNGAKSVVASYPATMIAGTASQVTVQARDAWNNILTTALLLGDFSLSSNNTGSVYGGPSTTNGEYTFTVTATRGGVTTFSIACADGSLTATLNVQVDAGALNATMSSMVDVTNAAAGNEIKPAIIARDAYGNVRTKHNDAASLSIDVTGQSSVALTSSGEGTGKYYRSVIITQAGLYTLTAKAAGATVPSKMTMITITPASLDLPSTIVEADTTAYVAGSSGYLTISAKDRFSNQLSSSNDVDRASFSVVLTHTANPDIKVTATMYCSRSSAVSCTDAGGIYSPRFLPTVSGTYSVTTTYSGSSVGKTMPSITVIPAAIDASKSQYSGSGLDGSTAGVEASLTMTARDTYGNVQLDSSSTAFAVTLTDSSAAISVTGTSNGQYSVKYTTTVAGQQTLTVKYSNTVATTYILTISPAAISATKSVMSTVTASGTAGVTVSGNILDARDQYGNVISKDVISAAASQFSVLDTTTNQAPATLSTSMSGSSLAFSWSFTQAGTHQLKVRYSGTAIGNNAVYTVTLAAAATSASTSTVSDVSSSITAGSTGSVLSLTTRDSFSNPTAWSADVFTYSIRSGSLAYTGSSTYSSDSSSHSITLPVLTKAGNYTLDISLGSSIVRTQTTQVIAASASASHCLVSTPTYLTTAGQPFKFDIYARDAYDNDVTTGKVTFAVALDKSVSAAVVFSSGNTYTATLTRNTKGSSIPVTVTLGGVSVATVTGSIQPASLSATNSYVSLESGQSSITAGVAGSARIVARDIYQNELDTSSTTLAASFSAWITSGSTSVAGSVSPVEGTGQYTIAYTLTTAATYALTLTQAGVSVPATAFSVTVNAAAISAAKCTASGSGLSGGINLQTQNFTITARDTYGNTRVLSTTDFASSSIVFPTWQDPSSKIDSLTVSSVGNGQYFVSYTPNLHCADTTTSCDWNKAYSLNVKVSGSDISSSPFSVVYVDQSSASGNSEATGQVSSCTAGVTCAITVQAKNSAGDMLSSTTEKFSVQLDGPSGSTFSCVQDTSAPSSGERSSAGCSIKPLTGSDSGKYYVQYRADVSGAYTLHITTAGQDIKLCPTTACASKSPAALTISPSSVDATASTWTHTGSLTAVAGQPEHIKIQARDRFGNARSMESGKNFAVSVNCSPKTAPATPTCDANGLCDTSITCESAATWAISVTFGGVAVGGSPYTAVVSPAALSVQDCDYVVPASSVAGVDSVITITPRDVYKNLRDSTSLSEAALFRMIITHSTSTTTTTVNSTIAVKDSSSYTATYAPTLKGTYTVAANYSNTLYSLSSTLVNPAATSASVSNLESLTSGWTLEAQTSLTFVIQARDAFGNTQESSSESAQFAVAVTGAATPSATVSKLGSSADGRYLVTIGATKAGSYSLAITYASAAIKASPFTGTIFPTTTSATTTYGSNVPASSTAGVSVSFNIRVRDQYSNDRMVSSNDEAAQFSAVFTHTSGAKATFTAQNIASSGDYAVPYNLTLAGTWTLAVTLSGAAIDGGNTYSTTVTHAATLGSKSEVTGVDSTITVGQTDEFTIQAKDQYGNLATSDVDASAWSVTFEDGNLLKPSTESAIVTSLGSGSFRVRYTATVSGSHTMHVLHTTSNTETVASPFQPYFNPEVTYLPNCVVVSGSGSMIAGTWATVSVKSYDKYNNARLTSDSADAGKFSLGMVDPTTSTQLQSCSDCFTALGDGSFVGKINITLAQNYTYKVMHSDSAGNSITYANQLRVDPADTYATTSVFAALTSSIVAGQNGTATVTVKDIYNNLRNQGSDAEAALITVRAAHKTNSSVVLSGTVVHAGNGVYTITFTPTVKGNYDVTTSFNGAAVGGSSAVLSTVTTCAATNALRTVVIQPADWAQGLAATETRTMSIQAYDIYGNTIDSSSDVFYATGANAVVTSSGKSDGVYTITFDSYVAGPVQIDLSLLSSGKNVTVQDSPFVGLTVPDVATASTTTGVIESLPVTASESRQLTMTVRDRFNNIRVTGGDAALLAVTLTHSTGAPVYTATIVDNSNGTYTATYSLTKAGSYSVAATLSSVAISGSFATSCISAVTAAAQTIIYGTGYTSTVAGTISSFFVQARDSYGNNQTQVDSEGWAVQISGDPNAVFTVTYSGGAGSGLYTVSYNTTVATTSTVSVQHATGAAGSANLTTTPNDVDYTKCSIDGAKNAMVAGDELLSVQIFGRDTWNNRVFSTDSAQTARYSAVLTQPDSTNVTLPISLNTDNGTYATTKNLTVSGSYILYTSVDSKVFDTRNIVVSPAPTEPSTSVLTLVPTGNLIAGSRYSFYLIVKDRFNNLRGVGSDAELASIGLDLGASSQNITVTDIKDGSYEVAFAITQKGTHSASITISGSAIATQGVSFSVVPAPTYAANVRVIAPPTGNIAGQSYPFEIESRDAFDNIRTEDVDPAQWIFSLNDGNVTYESIGEGKFAGEITATLAGVHPLYLAHVAAGPLPGSPFQLDFEPDVISADTTEIVQVPSSIVAGDNVVFSLLAYDQYNNSRRDSSDAEAKDFVVSLSSGDNEYVSTITAFSGNGIFNATANVTRTGTYEVYAEFQGVPLTLQWTSDVAVVPGEAYAPLCEPDVVPDTFIAGELVTIFISTYDKFDNRRYSCNDSEAASFDLSLVSTADDTVISSPFSVFCQEDFTYEITYTATIASSYTQHLLLNGVPVSVGQWLTQITPATVSPSHCDVTSVSNDWELVAGKTITFTIQSRDKYRNIRPYGDEVFIVALGNTTFESAHVENGLYELSFTETVAGVYVAQIMLSEGVVANSTDMTVRAFDGIVVPDHPDMTNTVFSGFNEVPPFEAGTFVVSTAIEVVDQFMNSISDFEYDVILKYLDDSTLALDQAVSNYSETASANTLTTTFRCTKAGQYSYDIQVKTNGEFKSVKGLPIEWTVYPAPSSAAQTFAFGGELKNVFVGYRGSFSIQTRDVYGNLRTYSSVQRAQKTPQMQVAKDENGAPLTDGTTHTIPGTDIEEPNYVYTEVYDTYGNQIYVYATDEDGEYIYETFEIVPDVTFSAIASRTSAGVTDVIDISVQTAAEADKDTGVYVASFQPLLPGTFSVQITMNGVGGISGSPYTMNVLHVTCQDPAMPYRYPNGSCHAEWGTDIQPRCMDPLLPHWCPASETCVSTLSLCACRDGLHRCDDNRCAEDCFSDRMIFCPPESVTCWDGSCRLADSDCPSQVHCPPGHWHCNDAATCVYDDDMCPPIPTSWDSCPPDAPYMCRQGTCVDMPESCPSGVSCPSGYVLCSDRSCQKSHLDCPTTGPPPLMCYAPNAVMCPDGSCKPDLESCPALTTCPMTYVQCSDGSCVPGVDLCLNELSAYENGFDTCATTQYRCPDGTCADHPYLCPSGVTCPRGQPVKCWDGSCRESVWACAVMPQMVCDTSSIEGEYRRAKRCPDGSCGLAHQSGDCPTRVTCPKSSAVQCPDGSCVSTVKDCARVDPQCPEQAPYRCPPGVLRVTLLDCPRAVTCPASQPVRCRDGTCRRTVEECPTAVPCADVLNTTSAYRCPDGTCVTKAAQCPTMSTCPVGEMKCWDGACVESLSKCASISFDTSCSMDMPYRCPDRSCAATARDCPSRRVCPDSRPVRCDDNTCATSLRDCGVSSNCQDKNLCPTGECIRFGYGEQCGTGVTCPESAPWLCWDSTCRSSLDECPAEQDCNGLFQCADGSCVASRLECTSKYYQACPVATPVRCADGSCKTSAEYCSSMYACPSPKQQCPDGSCRLPGQTCPAAVCTGLKAVKCANGLCVSDTSLCPTDNGCTEAKPKKCGDGYCYAKDATCPDSGSASCPEGQTKCSSDGTCRADPSDCPLSNGCPVSRPTLCADGTCITGTYANCTSQCPSSAPYACLNGLCVEQTSYCPVIVIDDDKPCYVTVSGKQVNGFPCAAGECSLTGACTTMPPCPADQAYRCGDGSCRSSPSLCPDVNTCPSARPTRCQNGMCVESESACPNSVGCPASAPEKCANGLCVANATDDTQCNAVVMQTGDGCDPATPVKCWNGACVEAAGACPARNYCPSSAAYRCGDGRCVSRTADCGETATMRRRRASRHLLSPEEPDMKPTDNPPNPVPANGSLPGEMGYDPVTGCPLPYTKQCWYGECVLPDMDCNIDNGCPATQPIRCPDGRCAAFAAGSAEDTCKPRVVCQPGFVLCADGSCKADSSQCASVQPCPSSRPVPCPAMCADRAIPAMCCAINSTECQNYISASSTTSCPASAPVLCPGSAKCVPDLTYCAESAKCTNSSLPYYCAVDRTCKASFSDCAKLRPAACGGVRCPSGECVSDASNCALMAACTVTLPKRCPGGTCVGADTECPASTCSGSLSYLCGDGTCAANAASCLPFFGCPVATVMCPDLRCARSYSDCSGDCAEGYVQCSNGQCVRSAALCTAPARSYRAQGVAVTVSLAKNMNHLIKTTDQSSSLVQVDAAVGALVSADYSPVQLAINPVPDSVVNNVTVTIPDDRRNRNLYNGAASLTASQAVLSPVISLEASKTVQSPMAAPLAVTFYMVDSPVQKALNISKDVCLGYIRGNQWNCSTTVVIRDGLVKTSISDLSGDKTQWAIIVAPQSNDDEAGGEVDVNSDDDGSGVSLPAVVGGVCGVVGFMLISGYVAVRLRRYRTKLHDKRRLLAEDIREEDPMQIQMNPVFTFRLNSINKQLASVDQELNDLRGKKNQLERDALSQDQAYFAEQFKGRVEQLGEERKKLENEMSRLRQEASSSSSSEYHHL